MITEAAFHHRRGPSFLRSANFVWPKDSKLPSSRQDGRCPGKSTSLISKHSFLDHRFGAVCVTGLTACLFLPVPATMSASSAAMPKAAALPARLLRTSRRYSKQGPTTAQSRVYHASTLSSIDKRPQDVVGKKKYPVLSSSRVGFPRRLSILFFPFFRPADTSSQIPRTLAPMGF